MTTMHTRQLQQYTEDNYNNTHKKTNNTHKTSQNTTCTKGKQQQGKIVLYILPTLFQILIN